jgi:peptide/nickel transport system substrate-binding protein
VQGDLPPELVTYLQNRDDMQVITAQGSNFAYFGFNMEDEQLKKPRIRRAIAHALNREEIVHYVFGPAARTAEAILPPEHWAGAKNIPPHAYDPPRARALLAEENFSVAHPLPLTFKTSSDPFRIRLATIAQQQLRAVGIALDIRSYDWGTFYGDIRNGRFQLFSLAWIGIKTPDIFRYAFHSAAIPPDGANRGRYADPQIDRLIEQAEQETDLQRQAVSYQHIQEWLHETLPYIPLWYENHVFIARKAIKNYSLDYDGNYDGLIRAVKD